MRKKRKRNTVVLELKDIDAKNLKKVMKLMAENRELRKKIEKIKKIIQ